MRSSSALLRRLSTRVPVPIAALLAAVAVVSAQTPPAPRQPIDFKVLKVGEPVTGSWVFDSPTGAGRLRIEITSAEKGGLSGTLVPDGAQILTLLPKTEGIGYRGELRHLLAPCGQDPVVVS